MVNDFLQSFHYSPVRDCFFLIAVYVCLVVILCVVLAIASGVEVAAICLIVLKLDGGYAVSMAWVMVGLTCLLKALHQVFQIFGLLH